MEIKILDHGYVKLIETWGSEEGIIEAARMSTNKGFLAWTQECPCCHGDKYCEYPGGEYGPCSTCKGTGEVEKDSKLLRYLYTHKHMSPFEMCGITIEVQAPIFVFREWHRHRTQSYNEMSARYTPIPEVNYVPDTGRILGNSGSTNKQASRLAGVQPANEAAAETFTQDLHRVYAELEAVYQRALANGIPKELARIVLPVGRYSRMRASANLRNWLQFLTLRMDEGAQWEIRQYANAVASLVSEAFPRTYELFVGEGVDNSGK